MFNLKAAVGAVSTLQIPLVLSKLDSENSIIYQRDAAPTALITGGSSGIGLAMAHELAVRGYRLLLVSNQEQQLKLLQDKWKEHYQSSLHTLCMDLATHEAPAKLFKHCMQQGWEIEVLINNAGMYFFGQAADADSGNASKMVLLHVHCMSLLCSLFGAEMRKRRQGYILNVSSISAFKDFPGIAYYGSSKAFIKAFSRSMQMELEPHGVGLTCTCPGATHTALYGEQRIPFERLKRFGIMMSPERVAKISLNAMFAKRALVIPGLFNKTVYLVLPLVPYRLIYWIRRYSSWLE